MTATDTPHTPPGAADLKERHGLTEPTSPVSLREGEAGLLARFAASAGSGPLRAARVSVSEGSTVLVAGVDEQRSLFVEPHLLTGTIQADQAWAVVQDLFKLALVARTHPGARAVLLVADEQAAASARRFLRRAPGLTIVEVVVA